MTCSKDQKVTTMLLKVDLDCYQCYKKVKKLLCQFPQIRNQVFDEKNNVVIITVVCCSPEKIRDKLCRKGGKSIKSIDIKQLVKPAPPPAPQPDIPKPMSVPAPAPAPAQPEKPKNAPAPEPEKKTAPAPVPAPELKPSGKMEKNGSKKDGSNNPDPAPKPAPPSKMQEPVAQWVPGYPPCPPPQMLPLAVCCTSTTTPWGGPCYGPGPGYHYGHPCQPAYYANANASRCDYYLNEDNSSACSIM